MATIPRPRVVSKWDLTAADLPERVTVSLTELSGSIKDGLLSFCVAIGLAVLQQLFDAELTQVVGPRGRHDLDRTAHRHGRERARVTLGGRRVEVRRPRARHLAGGEVELETYRLFNGRDLLTQAALDRMLAGLSTRRYLAGLEPLGAVESKATSRSSISRRFVEGTEKKLAELFGRDLSELDLLAIFIDGVAVAEHSILVALGVDSEGGKHPLGLWEGSTENKTVCNALLGNLIERGLDPERRRHHLVEKLQPRADRWKVAEFEGGIAYQGVLKIEHTQQPAVVGIEEQVVAVQVAVQEDLVHRIRELPVNPVQAGLQASETPLARV